MTVKERLDIAFHNKIAENENQNNETFQTLMPEKMSKRDKEIHNRRIIESIESNLKIRVQKEPKNHESDICQAYQILLSEHYKRSSRKLKRNSKAMNIQVKMEKLTENTDSGEVDDNTTQNERNETKAQRKVTKKKQGKFPHILSFHYQQYNSIFIITLRLFEVFLSF